MIIFYSGEENKLVPELVLPDATVMLSYYHHGRGKNPSKRFRSLTLETQRMDDGRIDMTTIDNGQTAENENEQTENGMAVGVAKNTPGVLLPELNAIQRSITLLAKAKQIQQDIDERKQTIRKYEKLNLKDMRRAGALIHMALKPIPHGEQRVTVEEHFGNYNTANEDRNIFKYWKDVKECRTKKEALELIRKKRNNGVGGPLLEALEAVKPGLAVRDIIEQSRHFIFKDSYIYTYDDAIACRIPSPLDEHIKAAVPADELLKRLRQLGNKEVKVEIRKNKFCLRGRSFVTEINMEKEIRLPLHSVEQPGEWKPLKGIFGRAVSLVQQYADMTWQEHPRQCVHVTPEWVEATNDHEVCRWRLETRFTEDILIPHNVAKHAADMMPREFSVTSNWVHFRNEKGLILSCRRVLEVSKYPHRTKQLDLTGTPITFKQPDKTLKAIEGCKVYAGDKRDKIDEVCVHLSSNGSATISSMSPGSQHKEIVKIEYGGEPLVFLLRPDKLMDAVKLSRNADMFIHGTDSLILIVEDKWQGWKLVMGLAKLDAPSGAEQDEDEDDEDENVDGDCGEDTDATQAGSPSSALPASAPSASIATVLESTVPAKSEAGSVPTASPAQADAPLTASATSPPGVTEKQKSTEEKRKDIVLAFENELDDAKDVPGVIDHLWENDCQGTKRFIGEVKAKFVAARTGTPVLHQHGTEKRLLRGDFA